MVHHQLASLKTPRTKLDPCHTVLHLHPPFLFNLSRLGGSPITMKTTSRGARDKRRVGGGTTAVDSTIQTAPLPADSLDIGGLQFGASEVTEEPQEKGDSIHAVAEEDDISPDDAPEVAPEDIDEEVCVLSSTNIVGSLIAEYFN